GAARLDSEARDRIADAVHGVHGAGRRWPERRHDAEAAAPAPARTLLLAPVLHGRRRGRVRRNSQVAGRPGARRAAGHSRHGTIRGGCGSAGRGVLGVYAEGIDPSGGRPLENGVRPRSCGTDRRRRCLILAGILMTGHVRSFALAGLVAIIGLAGPVALAQQQIPQQPPTGSGAITGTVIDGTSGQPVSGALVFLSTTEPGRTAPIAQTRQVTDDRGRFAFIEIPGDGIFTIAVSKFGFLDGGYGRDHSPSDPLRPVALKKDDWVGGLRVSIWRPGSISGVVRDESGDPVVGVFVRVLSRFRIQGRDDMVAGPITVTNDRGEYRIPGLAPGRYAVQVPSVQASVPWSTKISFNPGNLAEGVVDIDDSNRLVLNRYPLPPPPQNGRPMSYPIVFHPSASTLAVASLIDLKYGDERTGIDLTLTPAPAVRVSGTVEGPADAMKSLTLRLLPAGLENAGLGSEAATALVSGDGRFTFMNVPAGTYTLDAPVKVTELSTTGSGISQMRGPR